MGRIRVNHRQNTDKTRAEQIGTQTEQMQITVKHGLNVCTCDRTLANSRVKHGHERTRGHCLRAVV